MYLRKILAANLDKGFFLDFAIFFVDTKVRCLCGGLLSSINSDLRDMMVPTVRKNGTEFSEGLETILGITEQLIEMM